MSGTMRAFEPGVTQRMIERAEEIVAGVTAAWGAEYRFDHSTLPAVVNDAGCAGIVARSARAFLGERAVVEKRITGADDMAYFLQRAPGAYFLLGAADPDRPRHPHHSAQFDFDERAIGLGIEVALRIIEAETGSMLG
jgi:amidohydrolase